MKYILWKSQNDQQSRQKSYIPNYIFLEKIFRRIQLIFGCTEHQHSAIFGDMTLLIIFVYLFYLRLIFDQCTKNSILFKSLIKREIFSKSSSVDNNPLKKSLRILSSWWQNDVFQERWSVSSLNRADGKRGRGGLFGPFKFWQRSDRINVPNIS